MSIKKRCETVLIALADKDIISAMSICIKEGINANKYLERLAELAERDYEDDPSEVIKAATEGYKLADVVKKDDDARLPRGAKI